MFELASHVRRSVHFFASYVSQINIPVLLEASQLQDDMLQKDNDLHELRDINASLERKVSWFFYQHFGSSLLQFPLINNSGPENEATI